MAKGLDQHRQRQSALSAFGKDLARRAKSRCELCDADGVKLVIHEVAPIPSDPDFDHCILVCETCKEQLDNPKRVDPNHWRCLNTSVWSEVPAVQVTAVRMLNSLGDQPWTADLHEQLYLPPEVEEWVSN